MFKILTSLLLMAGVLFGVTADHGWSDLRWGVEYTDTIRVDSVALWKLNVTPSKLRGPIMVWYHVENLNGDSHVKFYLYESADDASIGWYNGTKIDSVDGTADDSAFVLVEPNPADEYKLEATGFGDSAEDSVNIKVRFFPLLK